MPIDEHLKRVVKITNAYLGVMKSTVFNEVVRFLIRTTFNAIDIKYKL